MIANFAIIGAIIGMILVSFWASTPEKESKTSSESELSTYQVIPHDVPSGE